MGDGGFAMKSLSEGMADIADGATECALICLLGVDVI